MLIESISRTEAAPRPMRTAWRRILLGEPFALLRRQHLGVAHALDEALVEGHREGTGNDRAGRRSDPDLVDAEDDAMALLTEEPVLEAPGRIDDPHRFQRLADADYLRLTGLAPPRGRPVETEEPRIAPRFWS